MVQIFIIFYSAYGHTKTMAEKIKAGVEAAGGDPLLMQTCMTLTHVSRHGSSRIAP